ncbi:MAG: M15 family metallopeptidase [Thiothrix sp.]
MNVGLKSVTQSTMLALLGNPRGSYSRACQPITNARLKNLVVTKSVGPFRVTGLSPAVSSLADVMLDIKNEQPEVYEQLGSAGMLCARNIRGSNVSISNHSWGTAIDLKINDVLDIVNNDKAQCGLLEISPIFNRHGWYWGAAFSREDSMHFEASDQLIRKWHRGGLFDQGLEESYSTLTLGDRGLEVKKLQALLARWGADLEIDGIFGHSTLAYVMAFQGEKQLKVDGVVGKYTWRALREV